MDDWYRVTTGDICKNGGKALLSQYYNDSLPKALQSVYPKHNWMIWKFKLFVTDMDKKEIKRVFFEWLSSQLGHKRLSDWYRVTWKDIYKYGGLLGYTNNSPFKELQELYPQHDWHVSRIQLGAEYWDHNQKEFLDWLGIQLQCKKLDNWYNVSEEDVIKQAGQGTFNYIPTLPRALQSAYPEHPWMLWNFKEFSRYAHNVVLSNSKEALKLVTWLSEQLSIKRLDDWYNASLVAINRRVSVIGTAQDLTSILKTVYPQHKWDITAKYNRISEESDIEYTPSHWALVIFSIVSTGLGSQLDKSKGSQEIL